MIDLEKAVLDLVRLGLHGDAASIRQLARRLLRKAPAGPEANTSFREALSQLLLAEGGGSRALRSTAANVPVDGSSYLKLLKIEAEPQTSAPVLREEEQLIVEGLVAERRRWHDLTVSGIGPTRTVLLTGAPGVGKTMTARFVASTLSLPFVTLDLAAIMSSFLGKTGHNLRAALDYARSIECVFLVDEFDALAKRRDDPADVGELKRIVNVLLLELETWPAHGLLIAATNHPELLDRAIWRRFDRVVSLGLPDLQGRKRILANAFADVGHNVKPRSVDLTSLLTEGASGSDLVGFAKNAVRAAVVSGGDADEELVRSAMGMLRESGKATKEARMLFCALASDELGLSYRAIGEMLGVSHVTVGRLVEQSRQASLQGRPRGVSGSDGA